jgi:3-methyladenine DNA glycosylase Mpg
MAASSRFARYGSFAIAGIASTVWVNVGPFGRIPWATLIRTAWQTEKYVIASEHAKAKALDRKKQQNGLRRGPGRLCEKSARLKVFD